MLPAQTDDLTDTPGVGLSWSDLSELRLLRAGGPIEARVALHEHPHQPAGPLVDVGDGLPTVLLAPTVALGDLVLREVVEAARCGARYAPDLPRSPSPECLVSMRQGG